MMPTTGRAMGYQPRRERLCWLFPNRCATDEQGRVMLPYSNVVYSDGL